jgi:phospholipase C
MRPSPRLRSPFPLLSSGLALSALLAGLAGAGAGEWRAAQAAGPFDRLNHIVVIFQENRSFDSLYGRFPGADGLANAGATVQQVDRDGVPYTTLPQPIDTNLSPPAPDPRFPPALPVAPFDLAQFVPPNERHGDPVHRFYQEQLQIDGGRMDKFVAWTNVGGLVLGYYDATNLPEGQLARQFTMADRFFHAAFGGSFLNHFWLICACTPVFPNAPETAKAQLGPNGELIKDGFVTPDGFVVNTAYTVNSPHPPSVDPAQLVPNQTMATIGDRLSEKGISWAWYSGGWNDALAGRADPLFQFHHQPFAYFERYADGTPGRAAHLKDEQEFLAAVRSGTLPAVSFVKPLGPENEHPGYAALLQGQQHVADLVHAIQSSPSWRDTAIIITYDENGGFWDHVPPPAIDRWGPGTRVPAIIISPYAKRGFVDHTLYDTTSILKTIEERWGLAPLGPRDAAANDLRNAFDFSQPAALSFPRTGAGPDPAEAASLAGPLAEAPATGPLQLLLAAFDGATRTPGSTTLGLLAIAWGGLAGMVVGDLLRAWRAIGERRLLQAPSSGSNGRRSGSMQPRRQHAGGGLPCPVDGGRPLRPPC